MLAQARRPSSSSAPKLKLGAGATEIPIAIIPSGGHKDATSSRLAAATALILSATLAHAASITGYVTNINSAQSRFAVGDEVFNFGANNTVGTPLDEIKEGDKVTVTYSESTSGGVSFARAVTMVEPAPVTLQPLAEYVKQSCEAELGAYCSQVIPGQNRLLACLYANGEKLSGQCETALYQAASTLDRAISTVAYLADQCRADSESKCASVQPGQGRIVQCLADHKDGLSEPCTQAFSTVRAQIE